MTDPTHLDVRRSAATSGEGLAKGVPVWRNGNQPNAARRPATEPAPTVHFGHNLNEVTWVMEKKEDRPERKAGRGEQAPADRQACRDDRHAHGPR